MAKSALMYRSIDVHLSQCLLKDPPEREADNAVVISSTRVLPEAHVKSYCFNYSRNRLPFLSQQAYLRQCPMLQSAGEASTKVCRLIH